MSIKENYCMAGHRSIPLILLISLYLQSCSGFSNSSIPLQQRKTDHPAINHIVDKVLVSKEGHIVTISYKETGQLQAIIEENLPTGFSKTYTLPMYIEQGMSLCEINSKQQIQVNLPKGQEKGYIYVGHMGLMGGSRTVKKDIKGKQKIDDRSEKNDENEDAQRNYKYISLADLNPNIEVEREELTNNISSKTYQGDNSIGESKKDIKNKKKEKRCKSTR
ncbi:hypothetical protein [Candidatus Amoebophilus asiaticus]|uniref:hypothetical protein n=1 Tax=Candidatus Amoebophilus asiaticus TaxID=281120 RepID=UPI00017148B9|nr:hypothetical protein [Candidatus Amoebophilus asiaticus]